MSKNDRAQRRDAAANADRVREAALELFGRGGDPSMSDIAAAAGVSRQTVHGHFPTRADLLRAVVDHITTETAAVLDAGDDDVDPKVALADWLTRSWQVIERHPAMLNPALFDAAADPAAAHEPIQRSLRGVLERAAAAGVLAADTSPEWAAAAIIALGHAAGQEVAAGRMAVAAAGSAFRAAALRCVTAG
jgi:AcrR family transcriptional regulator